MPDLSLLTPRPLWAGRRRWPCGLQPLYGPLPGPSTSPWSSLWGPCSIAPTPTSYPALEPTAWVGILTARTWLCELRRALTHEVPRLPTWGCGGLKGQHRAWHLRVLCEPLLVLRSPTQQPEGTQDKHPNPFPRRPSGPAPRPGPVLAPGALSCLHLPAPAPPGGPGDPWAPACTPWSHRSLDLSNLPGSQSRAELDGSPAPARQLLSQPLGDSVRTLRANAGRRVPAAAG